MILPGDTTASDNVIEGNYIGTDATGTTAVPNNYGIAMVSTDGTTIGGSSTADRNVISGNTGNGIILTSSTALLGNPAVTNLTELLGITAAQTTATTISGNYIGTDRTGTTAVPNAVGINLDSPTDPVNNPNNLTVDTTTIGGAGGTGANPPGNLVAGNTGAGILIQGGAVTTTTVQGNQIGASGLANGSSGIVIQNGANTNTIGGTSTADGNTIAFNTGNGVTVGSSTDDAGTVGNDIERNSITANTGLGISLGGSTTPLENDSLSHSGPNNLQNYPILSAVTISGGIATIIGTFTEVEEAESDLTINFYGDPGDPSGFGEGKVFLGSTNISTDSTTGEADINATVTAPPAGYVISATATLLDSVDTSLKPGDTSEFSPNVTPTTAATTTTLTSSANPSTFGDTVTFTATVTSQAAGTPSGDVTFSIDGNVQTPVPLADVGGVQTATFDDSALGAGQHTIAATYDGDSSFAMSTATAVNQVVDQATPGISLGSSANPSTFGNTVTFTATVSAVGMARTPRAP